MVKDVIAEALRMLDMEEEAAAVEALAAGESPFACGNAGGTPSSAAAAATAARFLRFYNLVVREIAEEYRRTDYLAPPVAADIFGEEAAFYGVGARVLAYGVAAEYCVTEGLDEAVTWDARYKEGLAAAARPRVKIPARRMY